jgi:uncharacterized repeat protein (TIGR04042 family)
MPELHFKVRWPNGEQHVYYSPSTTVRMHFAAGESYALPEFLTRARDAMHVASERVRAKFGYACSSALDTLRQIEQTAAAFDGTPQARVTVLSFDDQVESTRSG